MNERVDLLVDGFNSYVETFRAADLFTGPSLYFHLKTIQSRRDHRSAVSAIKDERFVENLYATLASWGMHRMGPGSAKLSAFSDFWESLQEHVPSIGRLERLSIWEVQKGELDSLTSDLWALISGLKVGIGSTKIVAGSKTVHHILPELVPPIDREYTVQFFLHHKTFPGGDEKAFRLMYPKFVSIAECCDAEIKSVLGSGMNTSSTKVIDNAIVGYVVRHIKRGRAEAP